MDEIKETIKVYIRQRPPNPGDPMENSTMIGKSIVRKDGGTVAISGIQSVAANGQSCTYFSGISHANHKFAMDRIFTGDATQNDVYDVVARPIVDSCLKGYAGLVLAYGPTGSGKTYTMRGPQGGELRGIMPRCIEQILSATSNGTTEVWASYLQIYCEQISDLLRDNAQDNIPAIDLTNPATATHHFHGDAQLNLRIKPDGNGVYVEGLMRYRIASVDDLFDVLERGDQYRSVAATNSNEFSSRSHAVLMLSIMIPEESTDPITGAVTIDDRVMREGQLMLVDLAGSERAHASEGRNYLRLEEAKAINLSLSALGNVMNALAENKPHVPYRDSKLTRLLQNCLGGTARTAIIVNVVPGEDATGETLNALRFANRASKVKVVAKISKHRNFEMLYKEALQKIKELEHFKEHALQLSGMEEEMQEKDNMIEKLNLEVQMQKVQINHLQRENEQLKAATKLQAEASQNATSGAKILSRTSSSTSLNAGILPPTAPSESGLPPVISPATLALLGHSPGIAAAMNMGKTLASSGVSDTDSIATEEIVTLSSANVTSVTQPQKAEDVVAVEAMSKSMKQKATDLKYKRLTQQVMDAERDLREERERHLRTVQELRAIHDQNISHESYFNKRIDELLQELTERQNLLDEHQQVLQSEREDKAQLEQELASTKAKMVNMVDKEQVEIMETLFQETIERMNQRVQNLELQGHQQQQIYLQEQQLHLQEKHQWLEAQQQQQQQSRGGKYNAGTKPSVGIAAKTGTTAAANGTGATAKKTSSTYAFWTPEGANALRQQQLKDQSSKDTGGAVKESPRAPTHVRNLSNSSGISQASDSSQELLQGRSAVTNTRLEPGGRLRPNSSNSNHLQNSNVGTGSPVAATGGIVQASSSSSNLRASSSAPKTLHSVLSPTASTTTAEGSNTSSGVNGVSAGASATTTSPRSSSVTRRSRVVVDPVTGVTTTTTTTTTTTNNGSNGGPSNSVPLTSSFRMATPSTPIIGGTEREPLARKMSLTSLHQAAVASSVTSTPPRAASNAPQFESY